MTTTEIVHTIDSAGLPLLVPVGLVAVFAHTSTASIWRWVASGRFPLPRKQRGAGSRVLWYRDDLLGWAAKPER